jgi:hypothetical protein
MKGYNLIDGLFSKKTGTAVAKEVTVPTTKRTFKISDDLWNDFIDLVAIKKVTQAELINELIKNAIDANRDLIDRYKEIIGEHK